MPGKLYLKLRGEPGEKSYGKDVATQSFIEELGFILNRMRTEMIQTTLTQSDWCLREISAGGAPGHRERTSRN